MFDALVFRPRPLNTGTRASKFFDNGYGVSVITGGYGSDIAPYELAVLIGNERSFGLCYDTPITDDVIGHLTASEVSDLMSQVAALPAAD